MVSFFVLIGTIPFVFWSPLLSTVVNYCRRLDLQAQLLGTSQLSPYISAGDSPHLLQCTHLPRISLPSKEDFAITSLSNLRDDLELIDFELDSTLAEERAFTTTVRFKFLSVLGLGKVPLRSVLVEPGSTLLACGDVTEEVEVIVEEV